jgi:parallel beta-helix repeat protein
LREAILAANASPNSGAPDEIKFNLTGTGPFVIAIQNNLGELPAITEAVLIDGYSQTGASPNTDPIASNAVIQIIIDGDGLSSGNGLKLGDGNSATTSDNGSIIKGLNIRNFKENTSGGGEGYGILILSDGNTIAGNFIGTNATGTVAAENGRAGIIVGDIGGGATPQFNNNLIGGTNPADRNLISGNATGVFLTTQSKGTQVLGNLVGTTANGNNAIPYGGSVLAGEGILVAGDLNVIGGTAAGARNVISGNKDAGIAVRSAQDTTILGNFIGVNTDGTAKLANQAGIFVSGGAAGTNIGSAADGGGNVISGNDGPGIALGNSDLGIATSVNILGNRIGTDAAGLLNLGNRDDGVGVYFANGVTIGSATMGGSNLIAFNGRDGIIVSRFGTGNSATITANSIHDNVELGIDLEGPSDPPPGVTPNDPGDGDSGPNGQMNFPIITAANVAAGILSGTINGPANTTLTIQLYANAAADPSGFGEGQIYLGSINTTTDSLGNANFSYTHTGALPGTVYSATATSSEGTSEFSQAFTPAAPFIWDSGGGADTSWFNPLNWSSDTLPGPSDTAILDTNATITLPNGVAIAVFQQSAGTLTGFGVLTVTNNFTWTGGIQSGPVGSITAIGTSATLTISGTAAKTLDQRRITLGGTGTFDGTGNLVINNAGELQISGTLDLLNGVDFTHTAGTNGALNIFPGGLIRQTSGSGNEVQVGVVFNNQGELELNTGVFQIAGGGTSNSATYDLKVNPTLSRLVIASTFDFVGTNTVDGTRVLEVASGSINVPNGSTLNFTSNADLQLSGGNLSNQGTVNLNSSFQWDAGNILGSGTLTVSGAGLISINGATPKQVSSQTINFSAVAVDSASASITLSNNATINVNRSFEMRGGHDFIATNGGGTINIGSTGTFSTNISTDEVVFAPGVVVNNSGTMNPGAGSFRLQGGGGGSGGIFQTGTGQTITFDEGVYNFAGSPVFRKLSVAGGDIIIDSGATVSLPEGGSVTAGGVLRISGGALDIGGPTAADVGTQIILNSGDLRGTGTLTVSGTLSWAGGSMSGTGITAIAAGGTATLGGTVDKLLVNRTLNSAGTLDWSGTGQIAINGATINNSGAFNLRSDATMAVTGGAPVFNNLAGGTLEKTAGTGASIISNGIAVNNAGTVRSVDGTLDLGDNYTQTAGLTRLAGGGFATSGTLQFNGGSLEGNGTITGGVNNAGATIRPGGPLAVGLLNVSGNYTQSSSGVLDIELNGLSPGTGYDQLAIGGTATLDGTLNATTLAGFTPPGGSTYQVVIAGSVNGNFSSTVLPPNITGAAVSNAFVLATAGGPSPFEVTTTLDVVNANDGVVSLREAILAANATSGVDTITFNIPGAGVQTISPTSPLPALTEGAVIDGYSQPGASPNTLSVGNNAVILIRLDGSLAGATSNGLELTGTAGLSGLSIGNFGGNGVFLNSGNSANISGNFIGVAPDGSTATPNKTGIRVEDSSEISIGGNIISGNVSGSSTALQDGVGILAQGSGNSLIFVVGNYIGTNAAGTAALSNSKAGIAIYDGGSNVFVENNVVSGNQGQGIDIAFSSSDNTIRANRIGVGADGTTALGNGGSGVLVNFSSDNNTIGGTGSSDANTIANNQLGGVTISSGIGNRVLGNSIFANTGLGIDLGGDGFTANDPTDSDTGANNLQNFPLLGATLLPGGDALVTGSLTSTPNSTFTIELFSGTNPDANGVVQGEIFLGSVDVTTDSTGVATFSQTVSGVPSGHLITATATNDITGDTSEFAVGAAGPDSQTVSLVRSSRIEGNSGTTQMIFRVILDGPAQQPITVNFATSDLTATAGVDYTATSGQVSFAIGEIEQTFTVPILGDTAPENREYFTVTLSNASGAAIGTSEALGAIIDEDQRTFAVSEGSGGKIRVYDGAGTGATLLTTIQAFDGYQGGIRVAVGDITGDGVDDIVAGGGVGSDARVRVFDGVTFEPVAGVLGGANFSVYDGLYRGGVHVAAGDVNGDGRADVIVSNSAGSINQVRVFSGADGSLFSSFRAFSGGSGGVRIAAGDVNGDGIDEVIVGAGVGSRVRVFDAAQGTALASPDYDFQAFGKSYKGGVYVSAGDIDGDGIDDIIVGAAKGAPNVNLFSFENGRTLLGTVKAYSNNPLLGVRVATADVNGDGIADIITAKGRKNGNNLFVFSGTNLTSLFDLTPFAKQHDGLYVG